MKFSFVGTLFCIREKPGGGHRVKALGCRLKLWGLGFRA